MAWPNLTFVAEGDATHIRWAPDSDRTFAPVRFVSVGEAWVGSDEASAGLAGIVDRVLTRLAEAGLPKTRLAEEWAAVAAADGEEGEFCRTVARLGLDPYSIGDETANAVLDIAADLPGELVGDFFDSADPSALLLAARWVRRAVMAANKAAAKAQESLHPLYEMVSLDAAAARANAQRPWLIGYAMARRLRDERRVPYTDRFDVSPWVGAAAVTANSAGIQGIAAVDRDRCGFVPGGSRASPTNVFARARALGRVLARPEQRTFVLSAARGYDERVAGAFAAELLAPAEGIRQTLAVLGKQDDAALEAVAQRFRVSALVVRHQYDNQLAGVSDDTDW